MWECEKCGREFSRKFSLDRHTKTKCLNKYHYEEVDGKIKCEYCDRKFQNKSNALRHMKKVCSAAIMVKKKVLKKVPEHEQKRTNFQELRKARRLDLVKALGKKKITLSSNIELCAKFIGDTLKPSRSLEYVVNECCKSYWLSNYTPYDKLLADSIEDSLFNHLEHLGGTYEQWISTITKEEETKVRKRVLGTYEPPEVWPWL